MWDIQGLHPDNYYARFVNTNMSGRLCWLHVELPGQAIGSADWTSSDSEETTSAGNKYNYPTMQDLAAGIQTILEKLEIFQAVLFGEGAGANLLCRVALLCDSRILGALLINARCTPSGPLKLLREKMRNWKSGKLEPATEKYLLEHRFSSATETGIMEPLKSELIAYRNALANDVNAKNLNMLTYAYAQCPMLLISGLLSDHRSGARNMYEIMNRAHKSNPHDRPNLELIELDDTRSPLIERPEKITETALYFLQGLGVITSIRPTRTSQCSETCSIPFLPGSPEKRGCLTPASSCTPPTSIPLDLKYQLQQSPDHGEPVIPARYLNRQLSMAELDLPRGPGALSSYKMAMGQSPQRSPRMKSTYSTEVQQM